MRDDRNTVFKLPTEWTFAEFADLKAVTPQAVRNMVMRGKLPAGYAVHAYSSQKKVIRYVGVKEEPETQPAVQPDREEKITAETLARKQLVGLWEQHREEYKGKGLTLAIADEQFLELYNRLYEYPGIYAHLKEVSLKTLYRWQKQYYSGEPVPNLPGRRKGNTLTDLEKKTLEKYWLHPNAFSKEACIRFAINELQQQGHTDLLSSKTYQRYITEFSMKNADLVAYARRGKKASKDQNLPSIFRDAKLINAGDILVLDGHTTNYEIINPATGKPQRMTLIGVVDYKSGMPVGIEIMPTENKYAILSAIRRSIITMGFKPKVIYLDNGRANRSITKKSSLFKPDFCAVDDFYVAEGILESLGIQSMHAKPYNAQAKQHVEWFFSQLADFSKIMPTYVGNSITNKPARMLRNEKLHRAAYEENLRLMNGGITMEEALLNLSQYLQWYIDQPVKSGKFKGMTRREIFNADLDAVYAEDGFEKRLATEEELSVMMLQQEIRTLYKNGIRWRGHYYWNDMFYRLAKGEGRHELKIKYDIIDPRKILVYGRDGFMCEAERVEEHHPAARILGTEEDQERLKIALEHQAQLQKSTEDRVKQILKVTTTSTSTLPALPEPERGSKATEAKAKLKKVRKTKRAQKTIEPPRNNGAFDWSATLLTREELQKQLKNRSTK